MSRRWPALVFSGEHDPAALSRAVTRGTLRRLSRGIYSGDLETAAETLVEQHLFEIIAHEFPAAVFVDRSATTGGRPTDGAVFVDHPRQRSVAFPGVTVWPRAGPGAQSGDMDMPNGLKLSSEARALLDNLAPARPRARVVRVLEPIEIEDWIDRLVRERGPDGINVIRDQARTVAPALHRQAEMDRLDSLISAALTTRDDVEMTSPSLIARSGSQPYDPRRLKLFTSLVETLAGTSPHTLPALPGDRDRRTLLPFYEAYFSNFIEGTEFTIGEAAEIVFDHVVPEDRPDDAHDIIGTYAIVADDQQMNLVPKSFDELVALMRDRHALLMESRPDKLPGEFKRKPNRAGTTEFVAPELVAGTLRRGFDLIGDVRSPFHRAVYMMFLVAEVHPFSDGNGRIARIMMNAELQHAREVRILVPTVYRNNYLSALRAATHNSSFDPLIAMLLFAQRYTGRIDFTDRATAEADLERTNAFRDANDAEAAGVRLMLP
ncbi:MAG TPA: Fic family protein [Acidimicrobiia bacterium]